MKTSLSDIQDTPASVSALRTDTLADSVLILLGFTVVQRLVGFCRAILFCRWLQPEQLGQWDMAFSFLILASSLAVLALPGAFGRYVERYRQQGQLRTFLRRTITLCICLAVAATAVVYLGRRWFSYLIFGTFDQAELVTLLAVSMAAMVALNFLIELFTALRNIRLVSCMQMALSLIFAVLGICLLLTWRCSAVSVVVAYGGASLITAIGAVWWLRRTWKASPPVTEPMTHRALWAKMAPFAAWVLLGSLLANLFEIADRYMIIHYSTMPAMLQLQSQTVTQPQPQPLQQLMCLSLELPIQPLLLLLLLLALLQMLQMLQFQVSLPHCARFRQFRHYHRRRRHTPLH